MNVLKLFNFNLLLGISIATGAFYLLNHTSDIAKANDFDEATVRNYIIMGAVVIFGYFAIFRTVIGFLLKTISAFVIIFFIYKLTDTIEDDSIVMMIDIFLILFILFALFAFFSTVLGEKK